MVVPKLTNHIVIDLNSKKRYTYVLQLLTAMCDLSFRLALLYFHRPLLSASLGEEDIRVMERNGTKNPISIL